MNKAQVDNWRVSMQNRLEELTILNAKQSSDINHIKDSMDEVKVLIKEQNGRVRILESGMSGVRAIGSMLSVIFSGLLGYLFTKG